MKYKATVYRTYEVDIEFTSDDAPEMIGPTEKAERLSRDVPIEQWKLISVAPDVFQVEK
jgi:hypothetical protein